MGERDMTKSMTYAIIISLTLSIFAGMLAFNSQNAVAGTPKSGDITVDDTWDMAGSPYWINGDVFVKNNASLTIDPGVEVLFDDGFGLYINNGTLDAQGTPLNMIKFTANSTAPWPGNWTAIQVDLKGNATISYCNITYADYGIYLFQSSDDVIQNNQISDNRYGLYLFQSSNNIIENNNVSGNSNYGIWLDESSENDVQNNSVSDNFWRGITLYASLDNTILNNTISDSLYGLHMSLSEYNNISLNRIYSNGNYGIYLQTLSNYNNITKNNISENSIYGLYITSGLGNHIYHNIFWNNTNQANDSFSNNFWDNGYPDGGNYWSDFDEPSEGAYDNFTGPNQDEGDSDGIVDYRYEYIDNGSGPKAYDNYPLMEPSVKRAHFVYLNFPTNNSIVKPGTILDFIVVGDDILLVNYSVNGSANKTFSYPWDINGTETGTWSDESHTIEIYVYDIKGNFTEFSFNITIDSIKPEIILNSPPDASLIPPGVKINLTILDDHLDIVNYTVNAGPNTTLLAPYNIPTTLWNGDYTIWVYAMDMAGNLNFTKYNFTVDGISPTITLIPPPSNNSVIVPGTLLRFDIDDPNLNTSLINYSKNGQGPYTFLVPYEIDTTGWLDKSYIIEVNATDFLGNTRTNFFNFTIDDTPPSISLFTPANNSIIPAGTFLDFVISDNNMNIVNIFVNFDPPVILPSPYDVNTSLWEDGIYNVTINAIDLAGNTNWSSYSFTLATLPQITLNSPMNNTVIMAGEPIDMLIVDTNLDNVTYSRNGGPNITLDPSLDPTYLINTTTWPDGNYIIEVIARDLAGNINYKMYNFAIDSTVPTIVLNSPSGFYVFTSGTILDFDVFDVNLLSVSNSTDGGPFLPFSLPYNISTSGWPDGDYSITILAIDIVGHENISEFNITLDSQDPVIQLISPINGSSCEIGIIIDLLITDSNMDFVNYSVNSGPLLPLLSPFDINTTDFPDGNVTLEIFAFDHAGNFNIKWYEFIFDDNTKPQIFLNSPANNSVVPAGTIIDFNVFDQYLKNVNYTRDGGNNIPLASPFDINTSGWNNGVYSIVIYANDTRDNRNTTLFTFTIDSDPPIILPVSPQNNSAVTPGTFLDFFIDDDTLKSVVYSIMGGPTQPFSDPYDIDTTDWDDEIYTILIEVEDEAGNKNTRWFRYIIDSILPETVLNSPTDGSIIPSGTTIDFTISDVNLDSVTYSLNDDEPITFYPPYDMNTTGWEDGFYSIKIHVNDTAGNAKETTFSFTLDSTPPWVEHISVTSPFYPYDHTTLIMKFNEAMNIASVESALNITAGLNYTIEWYDFGKTMLLTNFEGMEYFTTYNVSLNEGVLDLAGNPLTNFTGYEFLARVDMNLDTDEDGMPDGWEFLYDLDPSDPSDAEEDMDSDGYTNLEEFEGGSDPSNSESIPTKPKEKDSTLEYWWLVPILIALLILTIVLFFLLMGERKEEPKGPVEELEDMYMAMRAEKDIKFMESVLQNKEKLGVGVHEAEIIVEKAREAFEKKDYNLVMVFEKTIRDMVGEDWEEEPDQDDETKEEKSNKES
jgi:parallel beta-helix repeat protein